MLYGIIDVGSNTIRMAIYRIVGQDMEMLMKKKHVVGLAGYVKDGVMQQEGIDKAVKVLNEFQDFLHIFSIEHVYAFTTAALRNAKNSQEAVAEIEARTGLKIEIISGDEEATYDFVGATHCLDNPDGLLIDIGGGSTEIVVYHDKKIDFKTSLPIGSLSLKSMYVKGLFPYKRECDAMYEEVETLLSAETELNGIEDSAIVGIGGTFKGADALYQQMFHGKPEFHAMEAARIPEMIAAFQRDHDLTEEQTVMLMRAVPERMHTMLPGLIIADVLAKRFKCQSITYSDSGVREGYIYSHIIKC